MMSNLKKNTIRVIFALMAFVYVVSHFIHPVHAETATPAIETTQASH